MIRVNPDNLTQSPRCLYIGQTVKNADTQRAAVPKMKAGTQRTAWVCETLRTSRGTVKLSDSFSILTSRLHEEVTGRIRKTAINPTLRKVGIPLLCRCVHIRLHFGLAERPIIDAEVIDTA